MNQKLLIELHQDLHKQPNPFCNLEEVAELYHLTSLLDENIPNLNVPENATLAEIDELLSGYLRDRNIEQGDSLNEVTLYSDIELGSADLEPLECIDNQKAFDLLASLVALYSSKSINTIYFTEHALEWREDELLWCEDESESDTDDEYSQAVVTSAKEILKTKTAQAVKKYDNISVEDHLYSLRLELLLHKKEIPAFLETYISDALNIFEKCSSERFNRLAGDDGYYYENHSPIYYNVFFLYPENIHSHEHLITEIDEGLNADLQEHSGAIAISREQYQDIQFFIDAASEYKEVVNTFNDITGAL